MRPDVFRGRGSAAVTGWRFPQRTNPALAEPRKEVIKQMKLGLAIAAAGIIGGALWANAFAAVDSGLKPGAFVGPFQVADVNGPHKGSELCYR